MNKRKNFKNQNDIGINIKAINMGVLLGITMCGIILFFLSAIFMKSETPPAFLIEPIMIVVLALIVGVVILAVVIPMFSLYGQIG